jgi:hypothetical protein
MGTRKFSFLCDLMTSSLELAVDNPLYELVLKETDNYVKYCDKWCAKQDTK